MLLVSALKRKQARASLQQVPRQDIHGPQLLDVDAHGLKADAIRDEEDNVVGGREEREDKVRAKK